MLIEYNKYTDIGSYSAVTMLDVQHCVSTKQKIGISQTGLFCFFFEYFIGWLT